MRGSAVIIGPGYPLRGGLATFDQRLAREFIHQGFDCPIYSFSLQYPGFLFPGTTQYSTDPPPEGLTILSRINSVNPLNWFSVGNELRRLKPDLIVVRYWLPLMGPALGTILRQAGKDRKPERRKSDAQKSDARKSDARPRKGGATGPTEGGADSPTEGGANGPAEKRPRIIAITDNIIPHEKRPGDIPFTRYFLKACDGYITMSEKVMKDLRRFQPDKPALQVAHPLYDNFGAPIARNEARAFLRGKGVPIGDDDRILLFFGFIRKYKGLDIVLEAMADPRIKDLGIRLLVAGEFYEDAAPYRELITRLNIADRLLLRTDFIPDSEVRDYLCAADAVIQPYRHATQSGVTPLAYHFEKPMIVSNVGGLPALVPHEKVGLVAEPTPAAMADAILRFFALGDAYFLPALRTEKEKYSWARLVESILELC